MINSNFLRNKQQIDDKLAELTGSRRDHDPLKIENAADLFDQIQAATDRDLLVGLLNRDAQLHQDLLRALEALETGEYGTCEDCEESIKPARLNAIPWARYCVRCQERHDRQQQDGEDESDVYSEAA